MEIKKMFCLFYFDKVGFNFLQKTFSLALVEYFMRPSYIQVC
jgi:hypothetical protein